MARIVTFGRMPDTAPKGTFKRVIFPELARVDEHTNEGWLKRVLSSEGGRDRDLPATISMQFVDTFGHDQADAVGALYEFTIDGDTGKVSGQGWLADDVEGRRAAIAILSKKLHHNSVDLSEVVPEIIEHGDWWDDDFWVELIFTEWALGKTTFVAVPAFAKAHGLVDELDDEMVAALESDEPLVVDCPSYISANSALELTASAEHRPSWDHFHRPESDIPHKIVLGDADEHGWIPVYGHLAEWGKPHTGYEGRQRFAPRSRDGYRTFCQPSVMTDRGRVRTGPVVLYGGHVSLADAADDPRNAWADVRVTDGRHGPWVCGVVRPHIAADMAARYIAEASRLSGHWKGDNLRMIISCNAEGFPIESYEVGEDELVAGFFDEPMPVELTRFSALTEEGQAKARDWVFDALGVPKDQRSKLAVERTDASGSTLLLDDPVKTEEEAASIVEVWDAEVARLARERELALEDEAL